MIDEARAILQFDPAPHLYRKDGRIIPSVTAALSEAKIIDYSRIPVTVLEAAAARGTLVHKIAELAVTEWRDGAIDPASIRPEEQGYLDATRRFIDATGFQARLTECRIYSPDWNYAGTFDAMGESRGDEILVDWKSGEPTDEHGIQIDAYAHGTGEPRRYRRWVVYLRRDGTFKIRPETPIGSLAVFASAVNCLNYRIGKGKWPR